MAGEPEVAVSFHLEGAGWAVLTIKVGSAESRMHGVGYLTDAMNDLIATAIGALEGREVRCSFDGEPIEWLLSIKPSEVAGRSHLRLTENGSERLSASCKPRTFAMAVHREATRILRDYGVAGYNRLWGMHPFPERELRRLGRALGEADR